MLAGKKILIGVTGSIAAYKAALLVRLFVQNGADVKVIMTDDAKTFITPLTLSTLSKHPVYSSFVENETTGEWTNHVKLGLWADAFIVAPATGNTLAKMANGQSDNLLTATYLSARCPVFFAPAMDLDMWMHPSTQNNVEQLLSYGNHLIDVGEGELASGLEGKGRMAEPEEIVSSLEVFFQKKKRLKHCRFGDKQILITAGPTREDIDPVRFISNHSSGTMGVEIANAFAEAGARVDLILGPTSKTFTFHPNVNVIHVISAQNMFDAVNKLFPQADITIMAAAVADYRPRETSESKIKKQEGDLQLELERTTDILKTMGQKKQAHQILVGFALETNNEIRNAKRKIQSKNLDLIVMNSLRNKGAGFKTATNQVTIIDRYNNQQDYQLKSKADVALDILQAINEFPHAETV